MRQLQIIPVSGFRLYGAMAAREVDLARKNRGTFRRSGPKQKNKAKWKHSKYPGWIKIAGGVGEAVIIEVHSRSGEWQLLQAILGFVDRHFAKNIRSINIEYH